jgi:hypothetical protein
MTIQQEPDTIAQTAEPTEPCVRCNAPLAGDQRYCLNCGHRRAEARLPFMEVLEQRFARQGGGGPPAPPPIATAPAGRWQPTPVVAGAAVAALFLAVGLGMLIGSSGDDPPQQAAAPPPQVISVAGAGAAAPVEEFSSDWPEGQDGYTIQLQTLPKDGTEVSAVTTAKSDAQSKGATEVGALDSDDFISLDGGNYVIYNGVYDTKKQAKKELKGLKKDFDGAKIIKVSAGGGLASEGDADALSGKKKSATVGKEQLKELQGLSPEEYQKKAKKLPDETKLPGQAPPKDNKEPGGGEGGGTVLE